VDINSLFAGPSVTVKTGVKGGGEADGREVGEVRAGAVQVIVVVARRDTVLESTWTYIVYEQALVSL